jgi:hypothetical protein
MKFIVTPSVATVTAMHGHLGTEIYLNDKNEVHRFDGPAVVNPTGTKEWWVNGERHRLDGPAEERSNGYKAWWINGKELTVVEWLNHGWRIIRFRCSDEDKWQLLKANPEQIAYMDTSTRTMKEYVIKFRPDLIAKIPNLSKEMKARHHHEIELSKVDL